MEKAVSEFHFGDAPRNGKSAKLTAGHPQPAPFHVEVWINGVLSETRKFPTRAEADAFQRKEAIR